MAKKPVVLILVNKPHKAQMIKLKNWLEVNLSKYEYQILAQRGFSKKVSKTKPYMIITYNKNGYKDKTLDCLIDFCESGNKYLALHHNISSMYMDKRWLEDFTQIKIEKGEVEYPWSVIEGGDLYLMNLKPGHPITTKNVIYDAQAPKFPFNPDTNQMILTYELDEDEKKKIPDMEIIPAVELKKSEYFINHRPMANPEREILMGLYFNDPQSGRQFYSANGIWKMPRGKGILFYSMAGHAKSCFTDAYCNIIKNIIEY